MKIKKEVKRRRNLMLNFLVRPIFTVAYFLLWMIMLSSWRSFAVVTDILIWGVIAFGLSRMFFRAAFSLYVGHNYVEKRIADLSPRLSEDERKEAEKKIAEERSDKKHRCYIAEKVVFLVLLTFSYTMLAIGYSH